MQSFFMIMSMIFSVRLCASQCENLSEKKMLDNVFALEIQAVALEAQANALRLQADRLRVDFYGHKSLVTDASNSSQAVALPIGNQSHSSVTQQNIKDSAVETQAPSAHSVDKHNACPIAVIRITSENHFCKVPRVQ